MNPRHFRGRGLPRLAAWGAVCAAGAAGPLALGQTGGAPEPEPPIVGAEAEAEPSAGARVSPPLGLAGQTQSGEIDLSAARATVWNEVEPETGAQAQRLLLEGDARVRLGGYEFLASRAVVWVVVVDAGGGGRPPEREVAVYFDRVSDPGAAAGIAQSADRLLVTGSLRGGIRLSADSLRRGRPEDRFVLEGERRLTRAIRTSRGEDESWAGPWRAGAEDEGRTPAIPGISRPFEPGTDPGSLAPRAAGEPVTAPIFPQRGVVTVASRSAAEGFEWRLRPGVAPGEDAVVLTGGVVFQYAEAGGGRTIELTADNIVLFLRSGLSGPAGVGALDASAVRGVYLEGNVIATDGQYTMRGPRAYYDLALNRAVVLDGVFWTYDERRQLPVYLRAEVIRRESMNQFSATRATLSTSRFFEPHFSIGASSVTVTRREEEGRDAQTILDARNLTLRAGSTPFFYWPSYRGDVENIPLRDLRVESSSESGVGIRTAWDIFGLLGAEPPDGLRAELLLDGFTERGFGTGVDTAWDTGTARGGLFAYMLPHDNGTDVLSSGAEQERDGEFRGIIAGEHRWSLDEKWTLFLEGSYISDETLVDAMFEPLADSRREFTNAAYLRMLDENSAFSLMLKGSLNDFTPNEYLLQSDGYTVDKLPEARYVRVADDVLADALPGVVSWTHEYRVGQARLNFTEPTADELGFDTPLRSRAGLGILPDESIGDVLRAAGYTENMIFRADTRQEIGLTLDAGALRIRPFVVGRATVWDDNFEEFAPGSDEYYRLWGAAGLTLSTSLHRVDNSVESRFWDLHRMRHILEPGLTVWTAGTTIDQGELPVYDQEVESLAEGSAVALSLESTWQTQRGGAGRWRSVDWLRVRGELVYASGEADRESPIGRFFDYRPEYSNLSDHAALEAAWQLTDAVGLGFNMIYDLELNQPAVTVAGGTLQATEDFAASAEVRYVNALDSTFVDLAARQRLTSKYTVSGVLVYDTDQSDIQSVGGTLRREFPSMTLGVSARYNNITSESTFGVVFEPTGLRRNALRLQQLERTERGRSAGLGQ